MKSYFDGSGKYEDPNSKMLTLAGWGSAVWVPFEEKWQNTGKQRSPVPTHEGDDVPPGTTGGPFADWEQSRIDAFVEEAIETAISHQSGWPQGICVYSVDLRAQGSLWRKANF